MSIRLSCHLSRQDLRLVGMEIMRCISSEIDSILRQEIEQAQKDDPALIVRSAFDVIEGFLNQGMSMERIAAALQKHGINVTKGHLVRHIGIVREERGLKPLKRGRKPKSEAVQSLQLPWPEHPLQPRSPDAVVPAPPASPSAPSAPSEATCNCDTAIPVTQEIPRPMHPSLTYRTSPDGQRSSAGQGAFPEEITRLKFIEVKGELLDVTRMNIDDYLTVSKTVPSNGKIPEGMFEVIASENRIRGMYERALSQYDDAIAKWKSTQ